MENINYLDFELKIARAAEGYSVEVIYSPAGEASNTFTFPFERQTLESLISTISGKRHRFRRTHSVEMKAAREFGGKLFEAVFAKDIYTCFRRSVDAANRQDNSGLRIKLRLQDAPDLAALPWELLFDPSEEQFLSHSNKTPIVRYVEIKDKIPPISAAFPLRVLALVSSPHGYGKINVGREKELLIQALQPLINSNKVQIEWLDGLVDKPTLANLHRWLRRGKYNILHFIGHGEFDEESDEGVLILEDEYRRGEPVKASKVGTLLHDYSSLRLVVLNTCESARNSSSDPFAGVAATIVRQGLPAVVAMQFEITDEAAIKFSEVFYSALAEGFPVDAAVAEGRKAIYFISGNDIEWGTPVLYMRAPDGNLFYLPRKLGDSDDLLLETPREKNNAPEKNQTINKNKSILIIATIILLAVLVWKIAINATSSPNPTTTSTLIDDETLKLKQDRAKLEQEQKKMVEEKDKLDRERQDREKQDREKQEREKQEREKQNLALMKAGQEELAEQLENVKSEQEKLAENLREMNLVKIKVVEITSVRDGEVAISILADKVVKYKSAMIGDRKVIIDISDAKNEVDKNIISYGKDGLEKIRIGYDPSQARDRHDVRVILYLSRAMKYSTRAEDTKINISLVADKRFLSEEKQASMVSKTLDAPRDGSVINSQILSANTASIVTSIKAVTTNDNITTVVITADGSMMPSVFMVGGKILVIDVPKARSRVRPSVIPVRKGGLNRIRVAQHGGPDEKVRVVLDFTEVVDYYTVEPEGYTLKVNFRVDPDIVDKLPEKKNL